MTGADTIEQIVRQNLDVYEVAPSRLQEDVSQEAQVASDYRGRLVYELLQNADDAMAESADGDRVVFVVTDDELWIANSGRALTAEDVQGLCGLGASSKVDAAGKRRASIGHKGLGFKSVLEITAEPIVYSRTYSLKLGARHAVELVHDLWRRTGRAPLPSAVPLMRFPIAVTERSERWDEFAAEGLNTAFCFPFRQDLDDEQRNVIAELLMSLPLTTVLFLKHLESIEVRVERSTDTTTRTWTVSRQRATQQGWAPTSGLSDSGSYRVVVESSAAERAAFVVAHDTDVAIGDNRVGLTGPAWEGVELTEVSVATLEPGSAEMPAAWRNFHVFLPTAERCPYPILVNGAFSTDLSRQQVRVSEEPRDYNAHLIREAARVFGDELLPVLLHDGVEAVLAALDRGDEPPTEDVTAAEVLHSELRAHLLDLAVLPTELDSRISIGSSVVPPLVLGDAGSEFRHLLRADATLNRRQFPRGELCGGRWGRVLVDHGAEALAPEEGLEVLATLAARERAVAVDHESGGFEIDPVLTICEIIWRQASGSERASVEARARELALFPVARNTDRTLVRVAIGDDTAFYPPRSARHDLPLRGLRFMCHSLCWGALNQNERLSLLDEQMKAWSSLFDVREFRFEEVARAAVTPALTLHPDEDALALRESLRNVEALAAICQLAGRFAKPDRPLRYQRLQSDRALFPLSRLPVPCRTRDGEETWVPAYRVYFGADWIGDDSVEVLLTALPDQLSDDSDVHFLAPPSRFEGLLDEPTDDASPTDIDELDDEVSDDEDADAAIEVDALSRWRAFLSWIGVNSALRLVHFQDVEDERTGWVTTRNLSQPGGRAFQNLANSWTTFAASIHSLLDDRADASTTVPYLYEVHDLDLIDPLAKAAEEDATGTVAEGLFTHLVRHWAWFATFADARLALVDRDKSPGHRTPPPRAMEDEVVRLGDNFWLHRLQHRGICPTSHGPRRPDRTWLPSPELDRRFSGRRRQPAQLLPVLQLTEGLQSQAIRAVASRLAVRAEPSPSTFGLDDARLLCARLEQLFSEPGVQIDAAALRDVLKPVYRQLFELLSGQSTNPVAHGKLADVPLLAETSEGLRFLPSSEILVSSTPGLRERSGLAGAAPTFVLEADPASFAPLTRLFTVRSLEDALEWTPDPGECPLSENDLFALRAGLREITKPLLARIRVERSNPRDAVVLREFVERVEPVDELTVACRFDGTVIDDGAPRSYFVRAARSDSPLQAFVLWTEPQAWPPPPEAANGLAMGLADALGLNMVETFLAFLRSDEAQRRQLLTIAGATDLLDEVEGEELDDGAKDVASPSVEPTPTPDADDDGSHAVAGSNVTRGATRIPLRRFEDLTIGGAPILIEGEEPGGDSGGSSRGGATTTGEGGGGSHRAPIGTDLSALDALGMRIAIAYELLRLRNAGHAAAQLVLPGQATSEDALVVDVHTPKAIEQAEEASAVVKEAMQDLQALGISRLYPGCDLLTIRDGRVDRLIELKSSTVDARVQEMSWNEWKTARTSNLRSLFWLYLVGNLRADLDNSAPFVRAINDPFGTLAADERTDQQVRRTVQLRVREFTEAEHLDLGMRAEEM